MKFVRVGLDWDEREIGRLVEEMKELEEEALVVRSESFEAYETDMFDEVTLGPEEVMEELEEMDEETNFIEEGTLYGLE